MLLLAFGPETSEKIWVGATGTVAMGLGHVSLFVIVWQLGLGQVSLFTE
jgi:hypothetical protein